jgi:hypothetical protein
MSSRVPAAAGRSESNGASRRARASCLLPGLILTLVLVAASAAANVVARASGGVEPESCPPRVLSSVPKNGWAPASQQLAPKDAAALRLCGYPGFDGSAPSLLLERSRLVTGAALVTRLVDELDALPAYPKGLLCQLDDGSQVLALLAYPHGRQVTVALDETGCNRVTNGDVVRTASGYGDTPVGPQLVAELKALAAPVHGDADVSGLVRLCGGPAPSRCFYQDATVTVLDPRSEVVATGKTSHARFFFSLPPGTYTLVARTGGTRGQRKVTLTAHHTMQANIVIPIP